MSYFWLSFCDAHRPKGSQFIGACIVRADNAMQAVSRSWIEGCNPGGEVAILEIKSPPPIFPSDLNRLIQRYEIEKLWGIVTQAELEQRA